LLYLLKKFGCSLRQSNVKAATCGDWALLTSFSKFHKALKSTVENRKIGLTDIISGNCLGHLNAQIEKG
jgi:hypothetical protein